MDIKEAELIKGDVAAHWYYRAKLAAIRALLRGVAFREVLDVGAGTGFFARALLLAGDARAATCVDPGYADDHDERVGGERLLFRRRIDQSEADLVLMMDVLEHVPDDVGLLRAYVGLVAAGTHVLVSVPAFRFLWSGHDVFLEHYRRYTLGGIERAVRAAGLRVERGCYFYGALFPLVAAARIGSNVKGRAGQPPKSAMRAFSPLLNRIFWSVCRMELPLMRMNRVAGLTAFVLAVKP